MGVAHDYVFALWILIYNYVFHMWNIFLLHNYINESYHNYIVYHIKIHCTLYFLEYVFSIDVIDIVLFVWMFVKMWNLVVVSNSFKGKYKGNFLQILPKI